MYKIDNLLEAGPDLDNERPEAIWSHSLKERKHKRSTRRQMSCFHCKYWLSTKKRSLLFVMRHLIFSEAPDFLQGPRLQPAQPTRKSGPGWRQDKILCEKVILHTFGDGRRFNVFFERRKGAVLKFFGNDFPLLFSGQCVEEIFCQFPK